MYLLTQLKSLVSFAFFLATLMMIQTSGLSSGRGDLFPLTFVSFLFLLPIVLMKPGSKIKTTSAKVGFLFLASSARGVGLGLSWCAALTLSRWYNSPDTGYLEPLFTGLGLSSGAVLTAEKQLNEQLGDLASEEF